MVGCLSGSCGEAGSIVVKSVFTYRLQWRLCLSGVWLYMVVVVFIDVVVVVI